MRILYGTTNTAKLDLMRKAISPLGIEVIGLSDLNAKIPNVSEVGNTPLDNAEIKARAYFEAFNIPVFSCDSGLYFDGLKDDEQPGIYVRRVGGRELNDAEMTEYYAALSLRHGGNIIGRYRNAIYLILDEKRHYSSMDISIATEPFILASKPHKKSVAGFPLDRLSKDIKSGKYYYDMDCPTLTTDTESGLRDFFASALGLNLNQFQDKKQI
jgi:8-oxo-dGTP diphosphatase